MADNLKALQEKYANKAKPYSELEADAGGLGKTGTSYEQKRRSRVGGQVGTEENRHQSKGRNKYPSED
jgi:hypothetical protein